MRKVGIIVAVAALTFALCAAQRPERTNTAGQKARFTQVKMQGVASAIDARTSPRPPRPAHHARRAFTSSVPASPAPVPIQHTRVPSPPIHSGGLHGLVCSYGWSCAIASCIVSTESGWDPTAKNPNSSASGLFQELHWWWDGSRPYIAHRWLTWGVSSTYNPFSAYENTVHAYAMYRHAGWFPWNDGCA